MLLKVRESQKDKDDWLFSFLKLLETLYHILLEKAIAKQLTQLSSLEKSFSDGPNAKQEKWSKVEQNRLEHSFRLSKNLKESEGKWEYISGIVESRNAEQCKQQCIAMTQKDKQPQKKEEEEKE